MADAVTRCAPFLPRDKEAGAKEAALQWNSNGWIQLNLSNQQIAKDCSGPKVTFKKMSHMLFWTSARKGTPPRECGSCWLTTGSG